MSRECILSALIRKFALVSVAREVPNSMGETCN